MATGLDRLSRRDPDGLSSPRVEGESAGDLRRAPRPGTLGLPGGADAQPNAVRARACDLEPGEGEADHLGQAVHASGGHDLDSAVDAGRAVDDDTAAASTADDAGERDAHSAATVYGDSAYGAGELLGRLAEAGVESRCKTQPPTAPGGLFAKDRFDVNLAEDTVTCPNKVTVPIRRNSAGDGTAYFARACADCPLRAQCTTAAVGRTIKVGRYEQRLADARRQQQDPGWVADYRATRPKVERKIGHLMRRRHGGRRARVRGRRKVDADFNLLAGSLNIARLGVLGVRWTPSGWATAPA